MATEIELGVGTGTISTCSTGSTGSSTPASIFVSASRTVSKAGEVKVHIFDDECKYSGSMNESTRLPHGSGTMLFADEKCVYVGEWEHGKRSGIGRMVWANGDSYEGTWEDDQMSGKGEFIRGSDNSCYRGSWKENKPHGVGKASHYSSGREYEGDWLAGMLEGNGTFRFDNGSIYDGPWQANTMVDNTKKSLLRPQASDRLSETTRRSSMGKMRSSLLLISDFQYSYQVYPKNFKDFVVYSFALFFVGLSVFLIMQT